MPFQHRIVVTDPDEVRVEVTYIVEKREQLKIPAGITRQEEAKLSDDKIAQVVKAIKEEIKKELKLTEVK